MSINHLRAALLPLLLASVLSVYAGDSIPCGYNFLRMGIGFTKNSVLDQVNTCLPYTGPGIGISLGYERCRKNCIEVGNDFAFGTLSPYNLPEYDNQVSFYYDNFYAKYLWRLPIHKFFGLNLFAGPEIRIQFGMRINGAALANSVLAYDFATSTGVALMLTRDFSLHCLFKKAGDRKCISVSAKLSHPLLAMVHTPPYIGMPENLLQQNASLFDLSNHYESVINRFINPDFCLSLSYNMKNGNALALHYRYSYFATYPEYNPTKAAYNYFGFSLLFNLKKPCS
ncbi:MAG: hypothetical protein KBB11_03400 [Bacteroidales bacterium]|nr:hypothetical protein [Bacteroidales bacterium]HOY40027.1 hypothetical protein [Bacteroidales bacterium]HQP04359.1 hypothetical protein [Bacteroidales bacterium]